MGNATSTETSSDYEQIRGQAPHANAKLPSALVICGPSGVGKGTLINQLTSQSRQYGFSCSHTTRQPRQGEVDGESYHFVTKEAFETAVKEGKFLEFAHVHNNMYGTTIKAVQDVGSSGRCCILDIDVQGARLVRQSSLKAIFVFILPPSLDELEKRLTARGTESQEQVSHRLAAAKKEMESVEEAGLYDYVIVNDDLQSAFQHFSSVAKRALDGQVGNGSDVQPVTLTATGLIPGTPTSRAEETSEAAPKSAPAVPAPQSPTSDPPPATSGPSSANTNPVAQTSPATPQQQEGLARWKQKVALVTGASAGIGWAACEKLALAGLRVVAIARRREKLEALQRHLLGLGIPVADFLPVVCDITKEAEVVALQRIIVKRWPDAGIDVLVNNAGLGRDNASLFDGKTSAWVEMISTNVLGLCMCTREALADMKRRGQWGHIINISSMSGHRVAGAQASFYGATKHAVKGLTEGLRREARELNVPLRVAQISPGYVETEFELSRTNGNQASADELYSKFKCLQAEDIAQAIIWLLSAPDHVDVNDILMRPTSQAV